MWISEDIESNVQWIWEDSCESEKIQCTLNLRRFNVHWISEDSMYTESQNVSEDSMCIKGE